MNANEIGFVEGRIMTPNPEWYPAETSFKELKYPSLRDVVLKSPYAWLTGMCMDDGAEGLWRIHDKLYDLTDFIERHPGGQNWLTLTKGTDITEAFESHHMSTTPETMLDKYYVRRAATKRNSPFTFAKDGFYNTLKRRVHDEISRLPKDITHRSDRIIEGLAISMVAFSVAACRANMFSLTALSCLFGGLFMAWTANCGHNYIHQKNNWRMYLFNFSLLASREFRVTHVLSHHLHTNTLKDFEMSAFEPMFQWLPRRSKGFLAKYGPLAYGFVFYPIFFHLNVLMRYVAVVMYRNYSVLSWEDSVALTLPCFMYLAGTKSITETIIIWLAITHVCSFVVTFTTIHAAHHHPDNFHDGDAPRKDRDWGIHQLHAVMDRVDINDSLFKVLTNFGDHGLHHLFPAVDHAILAEMHPILDKTCKEFDTELRMSCITDMFFGSFRQMARTKRNLKER